MSSKAKLQSISIKDLMVFIDHDPDLAANYLNKHSLPKAAKGYFHQDLLVKAIKNGHSKIIELLIEKGCLISKKAGLWSHPLHLAVRMGDLDTANLLLDNNFLVDALDNNESTPLHVAVEYGDKEMILLLLERGANCKITKPDGSTVLHVAVSSRHQIDHNITEMLEIFKSKGVKKDKKDDNKFTALHLAAKNKLFGVIQYILQNFHSNINTYDENSNTIVHSLCLGIRKKYAYLDQHVYCKGSEDRYLREYEIEQAEAVKITNWLIQKGVDVNIANNDGEIPFLLALKGGHKSLISLLNKHTIKKNDCDNISDSILFKFINSKNWEHRFWNNNEEISETAEIIQDLIEDGAKVDFINETGDSLITAAIKSGGAKVLEVLLNYIDVLTEKDKNTIFFEIFDRNVFRDQSFTSTSNLINVLMKKGANINSVDFNGETILHVAANKTDQSKAIWYLLPYFIDLNAQNSNGNTIFHNLLNTYSKFNSESEEDFDIDLLEVLLIKGINVNSTNKNNETPMLLAAKYHFFRAMDILMQFGANVLICSIDGKNILHYFCKINNATNKNEENALNVNGREYFELFLEKGLNVNSKSKTGMTPLHEAAESGCLHTTELLLEHGADVNCKNDDLYTPLHLAVAKNNEKLVRIILKSDVDVNARQNTGKTALHIAAENKNGSIVRLLVDNYADLELTYNGMSILHYEYLRKNNTHIRFLLENGADINAKDSNGKVPFELIKQNKPNTASSEVYSHFVKMKCAKLFLDNKNLEYLRNINPVHEEKYIVSFEKVQDLCVKELNFLKKTKIYKNICAYDMLFMNVNKLAVYVNNPRFTQIFVNDSPVGRYSFSSIDLLKACKQRGIIRNKLMQPAKEAFRRLCKLNLPDICCDKIFSNLCNQDLHIVIEAVTVNPVAKKRKMDNTGENEEEVKPKTKRRRIK